MIRTITALFATTAMSVAQQHPPGVSTLQGTNSCNGATLTAQFSAQVGQTVILRAENLPPNQLNHLFAISLRPFPNQPVPGLQCPWHLTGTTAYRFVLDMPSPSLLVGMLDVPPDPTLAGLNLFGQALGINYSTHAIRMVIQP